MSWPAASSGVQNIYRNNCNKVASFLEKHHDGKYKIFNLSEQLYEDE
jgi:hypothetical protein